MFDRNGIGNAVGLGKEYVWDKSMNRGEFSKLDLVSDAWGCLLGGITLRCTIDYKEIGLVPRKNKNKYSLSKL